MKRKEFIRRGLLGTGVLAAGSVFGSWPQISQAANSDSLVGFNHLPNPVSQIMSNQVYHPAETRGHANHGWLNSYHTFSFANYYNPERMSFGVLRVLNDDTVAPGMGFGRHPHDNMEIISIPLSGDLEHQDSMNNVAVIRNGDIQVMSAGTGIFHSEYNKNKDREVKFLQIWVYPNQKNVKPRYDQITLQAQDRHNKLQQILSPNPDDAGVWIHQDAWFHLAQFDAGKEVSYDLHKPGNGLYVFNLSGELQVGDQVLKARDGFGIWDSAQVQLQAKTASEFLLMEVPMQA